MELGKQYSNNAGQNYKTVAIVDGSRTEIEFDSGYKTIVLNGEIKRGNIKDKLSPSVHGVGFIGVGSYVANIDCKPTKEYGHWLRMLARCYDPKTQERQPAYHGITVCNAWHNFQNFADWSHTQKAFIVKGWELDKDLLIRGNIQYRPEGCCFLPKELNTLLNGLTRHEKISLYERNGIYEISLGRLYVGRTRDFEEACMMHKAAFESKMKLLAIQHQSMLDSHVFDALINFNVKRESYVDLLRFA